MQNECYDITDQQFVSHLLEKVGLPNLAEDAKTAPRIKLEAYVQLARVKSRGNKVIQDFIAWGWS